MLQEILGHASITTALDLYGHLYPGDMDRYADRRTARPRRRTRGPPHNSPRCGMNS
jgi:hypothetical protein